MGLFSMLLSYGATSAVLSNCGSSNDIATVNSYGLSSTTPIANENLTLWIDYTLHEDVYGGVAKYEANLNGLPYYEEHDLCTQTECPILAGDHNESSTSAFPDFVGKLVTTISWENEYGEQLWCVHGLFKA
jgi:hypothetical protein